MLLLPSVLSLLQQVKMSVGKENLINKAIKIHVENKMTFGIQD